MRRTNSESLSSVINQFLRANGLETPLNQYRAISRWREVAGNVIADQTEQIFIRNQKLYVKLRLPALRANVMLRRRELITQINRAIGAQVIVDLVLI